MTDEMDGENDTCLGVEVFEGADELFVGGSDVEETLNYMFLGIAVIVRIFIVRESLLF